MMIFFMILNIFYRKIIVFTDENSGANVIIFLIPNKKNYFF